jgi:hypothetical protein
MNILDDLLDSLDMDAPVRTVLVGAHWTAVCSRFCGLASTITGDKPHGHAPARDVGHLHEKSARELKAGRSRSQTSEFFKNSEVSEVKNTGAAATWRW